MKKIKADKLCKECKTPMFQKGLDLDFGTKMLGWACPKCVNIEWEEIKLT